MYINMTSCYTPKYVKTHILNDQKSQISKNDLKNDPKMVQKCSKNGPKMLQKWSKNDPGGLKAQNVYFWALIRYQAILHKIKIKT